MFDLVHRHKRVLQAVLLLVIIPPFAFWGIQSWDSAGAGGAEVAEVGGQSITVKEFSDQLRQQQERLRGMFGGKMDPSMFDTPEAREQMLDGMVSQRLLTQDVVRKRMTATDDNLRETIASIPAFQEDGKFSRSRYQSAVQAEGYTVGAFESSLRRDLLVQQLASAVGEANIVSRAVAREWALLAGEQREISRASVTAASFSSQVKPTPEQVQAHYEANRRSYEIPEQARVEYLVLTPDALMAADPVTAEEIKSAYEARRDQYEQKEQRQASHILLTVKPGSGEAEKARVKARAEEIAAQVKKNPAGFADVAKKQSEDPGSAERGGDLGFFSQGMMVPAFEKVVFSMKPGEIAGPVESDFGFHVIRLAGIRPGKVRPLEEVRAELERDLRKQRAGRKYAESAEQFSNMVYEQPDSLKPVAEKLKLRIENAGWISRGQAKEPFNNPKLLASIFSDDVVKNGRNSEAVEVAPGVLLAARVAEHKPATVRPLEEVRAEVVKELVTREAAKLAWKAGAEKLEQLKKGENAGVSFSGSRTVGREGSQDVPREVVSTAFRAERASLPSYAGVESPDGYHIVRVSKIVPPALDEAREKGAQAELGRLVGGSQLQAYIATLRSDTKVKVNKDTLQKKE